MGSQSGFHKRSLKMHKKGIPFNSVVATVLSFTTWFILRDLSLPVHLDHQITVRCQFYGYYSSHRLALKKNLGSFVDMDPIFILKFPS